MFFQATIRRFFYFFLTCVLLIGWLVFHETGLQAIRVLASTLTSKKLHIGKAEGTLYSGIILEDLVYENTEISIDAKQIQGSIGLIALLNNQVHVPTFSVNGLQIRPKNDLSLVTSIDRLEGQLSLKKNNYKIKINLKSGKFHEQPLHGKLSLHWSENIKVLENSFVQLGDLHANFTQAQKHFEEIDILIGNKDNSCHFKGKLKNLLSTPELNGLLKTNNLKIHGKIVPNLASNISADFNLKTETAKVHFLIEKFNLNEFQDFLPYNLSVKGLLSLKGNLTFTKDKSPQANISGNIFPGTLTVKPMTGKPQMIPFEGGTIQAKWHKKDMSGSLYFNFNNNNYLKANATLKNLNNIDANVHSKLTQIQLLEPWLEGIANLHGEINLALTAKGNLATPAMTSVIELKDTVFTIPAANIHIHSLNANIQNDKHNRFTISGKGQIKDSNQAFILSGFFAPFDKDFPNEINLKGQDLPLMQTHAIKLDGSPDLTFSYKPDHSLSIRNKLHIHRGKIKIASSFANSLTQTNDVHFVDTMETPLFYNPLKINPSMDLIVDKEVHVSGYGVEANISAKLNIYAKNDGPLLGNGRITLKEGTFHMPGKTLYIQKGRLLFPPGTLLDNPTLDILLTKEKNHALTTPTLGIHLTGTLNKPKLTPFSNEDLPESEILKRLGLGANAIQTLMQTALLVGQDSNSFIDDIQDKLGIEQLSIQQQDSPALTRHSQASDLTDSTVVVVGTRLSKKIYLEYLKYFQDSQSDKIKIKYKLTPRFDFSVEGDAEQHFGADMNFSIESD